ncbi:sLT [black sea bass-associated polyomavirus 1]|uniref:DNA 3'-5' helicase n=1 Tax=black sea bass-associated polyomavirus 1 TaxID=2849508 RepID=A0A0A1C723_9POLY|nr:sLT [Black sea bass polyomavirus 1]AIX88117.1 sLT [Black sea bass polyomavirus 1]
MSEQSNSFEPRLRRALGEHNNPRKSVRECWESWKAEQQKKPSLSEEDRGYGDSMVTLYEQYTQVESALESFSASQTPEKVSPVQFDEPLREFLCSYAGFGHSYILMCGEEKWKLYQRILFTYRTEDRFCLSRPTPKGTVYYISIKTRYRIGGDVVWNKCRAIGADSWFELSAVKVKKYQQLKACAFGLGGVEITEGELEFERPPFKYALLEKYAVETGCCDPLLLLGDYLTFAEGLQSCDECYQEQLRVADPAGRVHSTRHEAHHQNAKGFKDVSNKKQQCVSACDVVCGCLRRRETKMSRDDRFGARVLQGLENLVRGVTTEMLSAAFLLKAMLPFPITEFFDKVVKTMVEAVPKKQGWVFRGPIDSGKSTVAAAVCGLLGGVALNVNTNRDRLWVELGRALDRYMVVFEDVKGMPERGHPELPFGEGFPNLDSLRECLDGLFKVGLERKHQNKVETHFPPWIVTCNQYIIPETILARCKVLDFAPGRLNFKQFVEQKGVDLRFMASGECLLLIYCMFGDLTLFQGEQAVALSKQVSDEAALLPWGLASEGADTQDEESQDSTLSTIPVECAPPSPGLRLELSLMILNIFFLLVPPLFLLLILACIRATLNLSRHPVRWSPSQSTSAAIILGQMVYPINVGVVSSWMTRHSAPMMRARRKRRRRRTSNPVVPSVPPPQSPLPGPTNVLSRIFSVSLSTLKGPSVLIRTRAASLTTP